jgi:hypothetical protein
MRLFGHHGMRLMVQRAGSGTNLSGASHDRSRLRALPRARIHSFPWSKARQAWRERARSPATATFELSLVNDVSSATQAQEGAR